MQTIIHLIDFNHDHEKRLINLLKSQLNNNQFNLEELNNYTKLAKQKRLNFQQIPSHFLTDYLLIYYLLDYCIDGTDWYFKRLPKKFRNIREIVLKGCKLNGHVLKLASIELRNDREVALTAIKSNPYAVRYISKELKFDTSFMLDCVNSYNYKLIPSELKLNKEFNIQLLRRTYIYDYLMCHRLRNDLDCISTMIIFHRVSDFKSHPQLFKEKEIIMQVLDKYRVSDVAPSILSLIDKELRNDREIVIKAVKRNQVEYDSIENEELKMDIEVIEARDNALHKGIEYTSRGMFDFDW